MDIWKGKTTIYSLFLIFKIREIVSKFEDKNLVSSIKEEESGVNIYIGSENTLDDDVAIIKTKYAVNGEEGFYLQTY